VGRSVRLMDARRRHRGAAANRPRVRRARTVRRKLAPDRQETKNGAPSERVCPQWATAVICSPSCVAELVDIDQSAAAKCERRPTLLLIRNEIRTHCSRPWRYWRNDCISVTKAELKKRVIEDVAIRLLVLKRLMAFQLSR